MVRIPGCGKVLALSVIHTDGGSSSGLETDTFQACSYWEPAQALAWDHTAQTLREAVFVWLHSQTKDVCLSTGDSNQRFSRSCWINESFPELGREPCLSLFLPCMLPFLIYQPSRKVVFEQLLIMAAWTPCLANTSPIMIPSSKVVALLSFFPYLLVWVHSEGTGFTHQNRSLALTSALQ